MVRVKFTKDIFVNGVRYGAGDIDVVSEGDALHLYGMGDAEPDSCNLVQESFGLPKENSFINVLVRKIF